MKCSQQDTVTGEPKPNLCVSNLVCEICALLETDECANCGHRDTVFQNMVNGTTCVRHFPNYLLELNTVMELFCIVRNFKGYTGTFILQELSKIDV